MKKDEAEICRDMFVEWFLENYEGMFKPNNKNHSDARAAFDAGFQAGKNFKVKRNSK